jgi:hypothetical protein
MDWRNHAAVGRKTLNMDTFIQLQEEERKDLFMEAANKRNMQGPILEKDFWVCWTLQKLFALKGIGDHLIFKGGTSLSKVFNLIERFSEDIDISINRAYLGFGGPDEPEAATSNKEKRRRIDALKTTCQKKITEELLPMLNASMKSKLRGNDSWSIAMDVEDPDGQTILFEYPTCFPISGMTYIRRVVKIEMGARSDHWPSQDGTVTPYVADAFPNGFTEPKCKVKVLSPERTFWEKATILHAEFHRPSEKIMPQRFSRHYCDLYELIEKGVAKGAVKLPDLLHRVSQHKALFFKSSWAKYEEAKRGTLHLVPPDFRWKALKEDYQKMQEMFFGKSPDFDTMMTRLGSWEREFNQK